MRYRVLANLVIANDSAGRAHHVYKDGIITDLAAKQRPHLLDMGMIEEIPDATPPGVVGPDDEDDQGDAPAIVAQPVTVPQTTDNAGSTPVVSQQVGDNPESNSGQSEVPARPPQIAKKEVWLDWAVKAQKVTPEQAESMTLEQLKALD
ncbi:hypothetical protein B7C42_01643 [Nocardia cerradoensis]|uniref:Uncharacterized protein n=1 Tax=Nocardia cerradoensis TaxID=85688 RepID=A0A231HD25_9NOCA|nr:hypothetical protein [Nocardia cerradoensis]OXR46668.1 hypothetical protein B7C42_01643 [Nocardia cerradoensis]